MATEAEILAHLSANSITKETLVHLNSDGTTRSYTEEEWDDYVAQYPLDAINAYSAVSDAKRAVLNARIDAYPKTDPQFDAIFHGFKTLMDNGTDIGTEATAWVNSIQAVKDANPFPTE